MTHRPPSSPQAEYPIDEGEDEGALRATTSVISAYGLFRLLLIVLTIWTFFEGIALATGLFSAVDAGTDRTAERMLGGLMIVLGGIYAMLAWQRERYRLLLWVPFAAQAAIVWPLLVSFDGDRVLLLVISLLFLVLMVYVWWRSRDIDDPDAYEDDGNEEDLEEEEEVEEYEEDEEDVPEPAPRRRPAPSADADPARRPGKFRRRDG